MATTCMCSMKAKEWTYVGEGGTHALFAYHSEKTEKDSWQGYLLRICKADLAQSSSSLSSCYDETAPWQPSLQTPIQGTVQYIQDIVSAQLKPYVDVPKVITLNWDFVKALRDQTVADNKEEEQIPSSRRADWFASDVVDGAPPAPRATGLLLWDYRLLFRHDVDCDCCCRNTIAVEIKPKAGYKAFSPLVDPKRRIKYKYSRFKLLQELFQSGHVLKNWIHTTTTTTTAAGAATAESVGYSCYDPLDLFSGQRARIRSALLSLMACPQNNLKVWCGNELSIGYSAENNAHLSPRDLIGQSLQMDDVEEQQEKEAFLVDLVTEILVQETLLLKLLALQRLDILDADGAVLVYQRLVQLCGGSQECAERLVDSMEKCSNSNCNQCAEQQHTLLSASPIRAPNVDLSRIQALCQQIETFQQLEDNAECEQAMNAAHQQTLEIVNSLSIQECCYLLQNWLLSLAMNDVSFFVTLGVVDDDNGYCNKDVGTNMNGSGETTSNGTNKNNSRKRSSKVLLCTKQTREEPGVVFAPSIDRAFRYELKIIDCGPKPAKKLRHRDKKEQVFNDMTIE